MNNTQHKEGWVDAEELKNQMLLAKQTGVASDRLGGIWMKLVEVALRHANFRHYEAHLKEDMAARAYEKLTGSTKGFKDRFKAYSAVSYCKLVIWRAFLDVIKAEYRQRNIRRELTLKALAENQSLDDIDRKYLAEYAGLRCGFGRNSTNWENEL